MAAEKNAQGKNEKIRDVIGKSRIAGLDLTLEKKLRADACALIERIDTRQEFHFDSPGFELPSRTETIEISPFIKKAIEEVNFCQIFSGMNKNSLAVQAVVSAYEKSEKLLSEENVLADNEKTRADVDKLEQYVNALAQSAILGGIGILMSNIFLSGGLTTLIVAGGLCASLTGAVRVLQISDDANERYKEISQDLKEIEDERTHLPWIRDRMISLLRKESDR